MAESAGDQGSVTVNVGALSNAFAIAIQQAATSSGPALGQSSSRSVCQTQASLSPRYVYCLKLLSFLVGRYRCSA